MINVKDLHKSFGENEILKGISTHVDEQEVVVVIGPSGSGKSTFLRCLNGLETATSGEIEIAGMKLTDRDGVNAVEGIFLRQLKWIFRDERSGWNCRRGWKI